MNKLKGITVVALVALLAVGFSGYALDVGLSLSENINARVDTDFLYLSTNLAKYGGEGRNKLNFTAGVKPGFHTEDTEFYGIIQGGMTQYNVNDFKAYNYGVGLGGSFTNNRGRFPYTLRLEGLLYDPGWITYRNQYLALRFSFQFPFPPRIGGANNA